MKKFIILSGQRISPPTAVLEALPENTGRTVGATEQAPPFRRFSCAGQKDSQVLQQCTNCTFANPELSVECQMCGEPLPYGRARRKVKVRRVAQQAGVVTR